MYEKTMIHHDELHVVFGTGPVGLAVMPRSSVPPCITPTGQCDREA